MVRFLPSTQKEVEHEKLHPVQSRKSKFIIAGHMFVFCPYGWAGVSTLASPESRHCQCKSFRSDTVCTYLPYTRLYTDARSPHRSSYYKTDTVVQLQLQARPDIRTSGKGLSHFLHAETGHMRSSFRLDTRSQQAG